MEQAANYFVAIKYRAWTLVFFFFFSSRRRHTRSLCDWSSDVCSSDLEPGPLRTSSPRADRGVPAARPPSARVRALLPALRANSCEIPGVAGRRVPRPRDAEAPRWARSEERRVGKECRSRWATYH